VACPIQPTVVPPLFIPFFFHRTLPHAASSGPQSSPFLFHLALYLPFLSWCSGPPACPLIMFLSPFRKVGSHALLFPFSPFRLSLLSLRVVRASLGRRYPSQTLPPPRPSTFLIIGCFSFTRLWDPHSIIRSFCNLLYSWFFP